MKMLRINSCRDSLMWYANKIGQNVPFVGNDRYDDTVYLSREPAGYVNIVKKTDCEIVEVE